MSKSDYIKEIIRLIKETNDEVLLDFILKLLLKKAG